MQATTQIAGWEWKPIRTDHILPMTCPSAQHVMCTHCGAPIPLQSLLPGAIWCRTCLREAPYRREDVTEV